MKSWLYIIRSMGSNLPLNQKKLQNCFKFRSTPRLLKRTFSGRVLIRNNRGSVLNIALLVILLLVLICISLSKSVNTEVKIAGNFKQHAAAFYAAEAVRGYVTAHPELYDSNNITPNRKNGDDNGHSIPETVIGSGNSFDGYVEYLKEATPPRGSGADADTYKAHVYKVTGNGYGQQKTRSEVQAGFYRMGY